MCYAVEARACSITQFAPKIFQEYTQKSKGSQFQQLLNGQKMLRMSGLSSFSFGKFLFGSFNMVSLNGKSMEVCEELLRREVGVCCIQEVRQRGMGSKSEGSLGRRFKPWWSGNDDEICGVKILVRGDLCMNVVEIKRISDKVMSMLITFGKKSSNNCLFLCYTMWKIDE